MEILTDILKYDPIHPLIFTKFFFWGFFAIVLLGYSFISNNINARSIYLLILSIFFYYKSSGTFFFLIIVATIVGYFTGNLIYNSNSKTKKKIYLAISIFINLFLLSYFKYTYFFVNTINQIFGTSLQAHDFMAEFINMLIGSRFDTAKILLPVGISFFTFQAMSYTIDIYNEKLKPTRNIIDFGFFVSFFPQLVAGPIVRASEFIPQIYKKFDLSRYEFGLAVFMILKGLIKKIVIGDYIAVNFVDRIFDNPSLYTGFENLMALVGYSLQVYVDFSGYTDIAIGVALLMGFRLSLNFNSPYKALNCGDFWKRWHISLSTWLKDYLYIPLGGNRNASKGTYINFVLIMTIFILLAGDLVFTFAMISLSLILFLLVRFSPKARILIITNINIMITMLLGGLWHGSSWNFLIWGGLNGLGVITYKYWRKISPWEKYNNRIATIWKITLTFSFITFTRAFFRARDYETATGVLKQVWYNFSFSVIPEVISAYYKVWFFMLLGFITHWLSYSFKEKWQNRFIKSPIYLQATICVICIFFVYQSICSEMQAFIYFQF